MTTCKPFVSYGRCRSGQRWFWFAAVVDYDYPRCDDPVCEPGVHPHQYGWEDSEATALEVMAVAVASFGGEVNPFRPAGWAHTASAALKRVNTARRAARPPSGQTAAGVVEYLYEADIFTPDQGDTIHRVNAWPIARKTAKRIYFTDSSYVSREELESDTCCQVMCPRTIPTAVCAEHGVNWPHCIHWGDGWLAMDPQCIGRDCGQHCPLDTAGLQCAEHEDARDHCPHHENPCRHGYPPGEVLKGGRGWYDVAHLFATREAAEAYLFGPARERERQEREPELKRLRREMADAHPDRGGTDEAFIAARQRYERALGRAS